MSWRPIETAERPSIPIQSWFRTERLLLWGKPVKGELAEFIIWPLIGQGEAYEKNSKKKIMWVSDYMKYDIQPTHWMPLTAPGDWMPQGPLSMIDVALEKTR